MSQPNTLIGWGGVGVYLAVAEVKYAVCLRFIPTKYMVLISINPREANWILASDLYLVYPNGSFFRGVVSYNMGIIPKPGRIRI